MSSSAGAAEDEGPRLLSIVTYILAFWGLDLGPAWKPNLIERVCCSAPDFIVPRIHAIGKLYKLVKLKKIF